MPKNAALEQDWKDESQQHTLSEKDREKLKQKEASISEIGGKIGAVRQNFINRVQLEKFIDLKAKKEFIQRARSIRNEEHFSRLEEQFQYYLTQSQDKIKEFEKTLGQKKGLLHKGEDESLLNHFVQASLENKEDEVEKLEKMLTEREKILSKADRLDKDLQKKFKEIAGDEDIDYAEKVRNLQSLEVTNKLYQKYQKLFDVEGIGQKTKADYFRWFLARSQEQQEWAVEKAKQEDIEPRVKMYQIHQKLPREYQDNQFADWGKTERENYLARIEKQLDEKYQTMLWSKDADICTNSKLHAQEEFEKLKGPDNLVKKIELLRTFPRHAAAETKLRTQLERFSSTLWKPVVARFNESRFEEKVSIIQELAKRENEFRQIQHGFNRLPKAIRSKFEKKLIEANSQESLKRILDDAQKYAEYRKEYFDLFVKNKKYFLSSKAEYDDRYNANVHTTEQARQAVIDLQEVIGRRKEYIDGFEALPKEIQTRCPEFLKLRTNHKKEQLGKLQEIHHKSQAVAALDESAQKLIQTEMYDQARNLYETALKLDPENEDLKEKLEDLDLKTLKINPESEKKSSQKDVIDKQLTDSFTEQNKDIKDLSTLEEITQVVERNVRVRGGTTKEDAHSRSKGLFKSVSADEREIANEFGKHEQDFVIDNHGQAQEIDQVHFNREQDIRRMRTEIQYHHKKGDNEGRSGRIDVELRKEDGTVKNVSQARAEIEKRKNELAEDRIQTVLQKLSHGQTKFTQEQLAALRQAMSEDVEEEIAQKRG